MPGRRIGVPKHLPNLKSTDSNALPKEVRSLIRGKTVDLSSASKYYRRCWTGVKDRVVDEWEEKGENRYKLRGRFFKYFLKLLSEVVEQHFGRSPMNGAELIANALYRAAYLYGQRLSPGIDPSEWNRAWPDHRSVADAWQRLGELSVPGGTGFLFEDPGPGSDLRIANLRDFNCPRIAVRLNWNQDRRKLPCLTIQIEGEPVCMLMKAGYLLKNLEERRAVRREAKRIWKTLNNRISADFGVHNLKEGRPAENMGSQAAYLHDHKGLSWKQVAQEVCQEKHSHGHACRENFRKQAEQWWKKLQRNAISDRSRE